MNDNETIRNDGQLLDCVYVNLLKISSELMDQDRTNPNLVEVYISLLTTYFDIQEDGF